MRAALDIFVVFDVQILLDAQVTGLDKLEPVLATLAGGNTLKVMSIQAAKSNLSHASRVLVRLDWNKPLVYVGTTEGSCTYRRS